MKYRKICPICGAHFETNNDQTIYCGHFCKAEAKRARDREYQRIKREQESESRRQYREEYERARLSELAEREKKLKADFERRIAEGDPRALMLREQGQHGKATKEYWRLFKQCCIEEAEAARKASKTTVNGFSVYNDCFEDLVLESIKAGAAIITRNG